jgi:hypothetical protein
MNTLEWYHDMIDYLSTFIGKEIPDPNSVTGISVVKSFNSRTREFALINDDGVRYVSYLELDKMIGH